MIRPTGYDRCNRFTTIIVDEALRRGLDVEVLDPELGELRIGDGRREEVVIQSLSQRLPAVSYFRCEHKVASRRVLSAAGLPLPAGHVIADDATDGAFLRQHGTVVVKPARGEGGEGVTVGVADVVGLHEAVEIARRHHETVLAEEMVEGEDLRVLVIDGSVVAASVRRPPVVVGDGTRTVGQLADALNAERRGKEGAIEVPLDDRTLDVLAGQGTTLDDVLDDGRRVVLRRTANVHTGGTITDVTDRLHPSSVETACRAARAVGAPLLGVDLIVPDVEGDGGVIIEVNPMPGLANHEPQPTAQRYLDMLFGAE